MLLTVSVLSLSTIGVVLGSFQRLDLNIHDSETSLGSNQMQDVVAVTFDGPNDSLDCTKYYPKGTVLTLKDAPYYMNGSDYVYWSCNNTVLNQHITVNSNITITGSTMNSSYIDSSDHSYTESLNSGSKNAKDGSTAISSLIQNYTLNKYVYSGNTSTYLASSDIDSQISVGNYNVWYKFTNSRIYFDSDEDNLLNVRTESGTHNLVESIQKVRIADNSIALDVPSGISDASIYKPTTTGGTIESATNPCTIKLKLQNDIYLSGNMSLYARIGVSGNVSNGSAGGWGQASIQGIIVASYVELDLAGFDIIVGNGGMIDAYGSITNSGTTGQIVLESGSTMYASLVIEDVYREDSMPTAYFNNSCSFFLFRCPYINCNITIKTGASFYGKFNLRLGGSSDYGVSNDVLLIGNSSSAWFQLTSGEINRKINYLQGLYDNGNNSTKKFLMHQRFKYQFNDATVNVNHYSIPFEYSSINYTFNSGKAPFFVPPYFDFELYNSQITIQNLYVFLPPSQVFVDAKSKIILTNSGQITSPGMNSSGASQSEQYYEAVGGLYFTDFFYSFAESNKHFDTTKKRKSDGYGGVTLKDASNATAFNVYNQTPASCTMNGKFEIKQTSSFTGKHNFTLAGNINIRNMDDFADAIKDKPVQLFASVHLQGPNRFLHVNIFMPVQEVKINIMGLYNSPLISFNNVLTPMNGETGEVNGQFNVTKKRTFNRFTRLVTDSDTEKTYAFLFDDVVKDNITNNNLYQANNFSGYTSDSLYGYFAEVTAGDNKIITYNGESYFPYQGAFLKVKAKNSETQVQATSKKFWGNKAGDLPLEVNGGVANFNYTNKTEDSKGNIIDLSWTLGEKVWVLENSYKFTES